MRLQKQSAPKPRPNQGFLLRTASTVIFAAAIGAGTSKGNAETLYTTPEKTAAVVQLSSADSEARLASNGCRGPGVYTWGDGERYFCPGTDTFIHDTIEIKEGITIAPKMIQRKAAVKPDLVNWSLGPAGMPIRAPPRHVQAPQIADQKPPISAAYIKEYLKEVGESILSFGLVTFPIWLVAGRGIYKNRKSLVMRKPAGSNKAP